eukprot:4454898-Pleurochrysis_carterae.AAC.1
MQVLALGHGGERHRCRAAWRFAQANSSAERQLRRSLHPVAGTLLRADLIPPLHQLFFCYFPDYASLARGHRRFVCTSYFLRCSYRAHTLLNR